MSRNQLVSKPSERELTATGENRGLIAYFHIRKNHKDSSNRYREGLRQRMHDKLAARRLRCVQLVVTVLSCFAVTMSPVHAQPTLVDPARYTLELFTQFPSDNVSIGKSRPFHLSFDANGNLFVGVEAGFNQATDKVRIRKVSPDGIVNPFGPQLFRPRWDPCRYRWTVLRARLRPCKPDHTRNSARSRDQRDPA